MADFDNHSERANNPSQVSDTDLLLRLHVDYVADEGEHIRLMQTTLRFYTGVILATIGGAILILKDIRDPIMVAVGFMIAGVLVVGSSYFGIRAAQSAYRRHLETICMRAKLHDLLGLDDMTRFGGKKLWPSETLILPRYRKDRSEFNSSEEFVKDRLSKGMMRVIRGFYLVTGGLGVIIAVVGTARSSWIGENLSKTTTTSPCAETAISPSNRKAAATDTGRSISEVREQGAQQGDGTSPAKQ